MNSSRKDHIAGHHTMSMVKRHKELLSFLGVLYFDLDSNNIQNNFIETFKEFIHFMDMIFITVP